LAGKSAAANSKPKQKIIQQVELVEKPFVVTEHVAQGYWCQGCQVLVLGYEIWLVSC
jgi:hypothetical protein